MYAIVRGGGRQHRVAVGDVVDIDRTADQVGANINLQPVLLVDGDSVTSDPGKLDAASVSAEVLGNSAGPKINIVKFKRKTGYQQRIGHRQRYTRVKVTGIES